MNGFGPRTAALLAALVLGLAPDSVGLAAYDPADNPFGWFVILRIE